MPATSVWQSWSINIKGCCGNLSNAKETALYMVLSLFFGKKPGLAYFWVLFARKSTIRITDKIMGEILIAGRDGFVRDMVAATALRAGLSAVCVASLSEAADDCRRGRYERVVVIGCSTFADGEVAVESLRPRGCRRPEIYVISWHHSERAVLSLLECGVNQYITLPVDLRRLCLKLGGR